MVQSKSGSACWIRLPSIALPDGRQQSWGYDRAGRVNGVIQPGGGSWTVAHNGAGQPTVASVPSGGSQVWGYDNAGRAVSATWLQPGNSTFSQVATLDAAGQRKGLADSWGTVTYGYDRAGRLTSAAYPDGSTEADSYDPAGNRTMITATTALSGTAVTTNSYDAADQLSTAATAGGAQPGTTTYGYDGNGNQTGSSGPAGTVANTFNDLNQLTHITGPGTNLTLLYDGQGDRLRRYERGTPTWTLRDEAQDLASGLSALVSDGTADYAYLSPGDGSAPLSSYTPGTARASYLGTDLLGSVRLATDPSGATIGSGAYDAWGTARPYAGGSGATQLAGLQGVAPFGYAGQQRDAGPGTYAMRARRYDPATGRFQSQDSARPQPMRPITLDPYAYAWDVPTLLTDPSGLSPRCGGGPDHARAAAIAVGYEAFRFPYMAQNAGCELNIPGAKYREQFQKAVLALRNKKKPTYDPVLYATVINEIRTGDLLGLYFLDNPNDARKCGYRQLSDRPIDATARADVVGDYEGHGSDLYEVESLSDVLGYGANYYALEAWYYVNAAAGFDPSRGVPKDTFVQNEAGKVRTSWATGGKNFQLGHNLPPILPVKTGETYMILGTLDIPTWREAKSGSFTAGQISGVAWYYTTRGSDWIQELSAALQKRLAAAKALDYVAIAIRNTIQTERRAGLVTLPGSVFPEDQLIIFPPDNQSCGPVGCTWAWFQHGGETIWTGVTNQVVTAFGGNVFTRVAINGLVASGAITIGTLVKQLLSPDPGIAHPARDIGVHIVTVA